MKPGIPWPVAQELSDRRSERRYISVASDAGADLRSALTQSQRKLGRFVKYTPFYSPIFELTTVKLAFALPVNEDREK